MPTPNTADWVYGTPTTGTVQRIISERSFAFIRSGTEEYFMHHTDYSGEFPMLKVGDQVVFTPTDTPKGPRACYVDKQTGVGRVAARGKGPHAQ